jgi:hypothetical protein
MYLVDDEDKPVDAEFSLDLVDSEFCVVVESSGGSNPKRGVKRRNPDYNRLLNILLFRLASSGARITRVILDSERVADLPASERVAKLDIPYPVNLSAVNVDEFRKMLGRKIAAMHRDPDATRTGNAQKRMRLCLDTAVAPEQLVVGAGKAPLADPIPEYAPGLGETEKECLRAARRGQGPFRKALLKLYGASCPVTGITNSELLLASHIKPWSVSNNSERLDPDNGILLSALIDRLFDRGLITFEDDGAILVSQKLSPVDRALCNVDAVRPIKFSERTRHYLGYHRDIEFKRPFHSPKREIGAIRVPQPSKEPCKQ